MLAYRELSFPVKALTNLFFIASFICSLSNAATGYAKSNSELTGPFLHGVASGDPLPDKVILWSRVTPKSPGTVSVKWIIAKDKLLKAIVKSGQITTDSTKDYTVKVDVGGLTPATTYYYMFTAYNQNSPVGRTKTAAATTVASLSFAVVSCSNYAEGYFTALGKIATRENLNGVIHLGDYIYESIERAFENRKIDIKPQKESAAGKDKQWWLNYYRKRYEVSRLDSNLLRAHQNHPFITIWDDHETADNAYKDGASGHNPAVDGSWEVRKEAAKQAYAEWMPIRGNASKIYRSLKFGNLMELVLLDTRLEGRHKQIYNSSDPALYDPERSILGVQQKNYLLDKLKTSTAHWKLIGNQVIFSDFNVGWAANAGPFTEQVKQLENNLLDYWQGYPKEREQILTHITNNKINNVVILSASMHCALACDVMTPVLQKKDLQDTPQKGNHPIAVEFAAPSISSANFDEKVGSYAASSFESVINKPLPPPFNFNPNPHIKFVDVNRHGYFILHVLKEKVQADYYFIQDKFDPNTTENFVEGWYTNNGENHLQKASGELYK